MKKNMPEEKQQGSVEAGSPDTSIESGPSANELGGKPDGEDKKIPANAAQIADTVSKADYEKIKAELEQKDKSYSELEKKLSEQGEELGQNREFIRGIEPILDTLEAHPDLAKALYEGSIDPALIESALLGKTTVQDAQQVTEVHNQLKKEMGDDYSKAKPEEIKEEVLKRLENIDQNIEKKSKIVKEEILEEVSRKQDIRDFQEKTEQFIENTKDFAEYAEDVAKWLEEHPRIDDIKVAYEAVKGIKLSEEKRLAMEKAAAEEQKKNAINASGGQSQSAQIVQDEELVDQLIAPRSNPNLF